MPPAYRPSRLSRRQWLAQASGWLTTAIALNAGFSAQAASPPVLRLPAAIAYTRYSPSGLEHLTQQDRDAWTRFSTRLGGLISRIEPYQTSRIMAGQAPRMDGGGAAALAARNSAARAGYDYVILYAVLSEEMLSGSHPAPPVAQSPADRMSLKRTQKGYRWVFEKVGAKDPPEPIGPWAGEAHLFDVAGGPPLISCWAEAESNGALGVLRRRNDPGAEILNQLTLDMERKVQNLARSNFQNRRSIAD